MKKYIITLLLALCFLAVPITVYATDAAADEPITVEEELSAPLPVADKGVEAEDGWFEEARDWVSEHFSGIIVSLTTLYAVFPKYGGIAAVIKALKNIAALFALVKTYMDDEKNENSIYNVLKRQGDTITRFMNDVAPALEDIRADKEATEALKTELVSAKDVIERQKNVFLAVEEAVELMAAEFSDLISISTTVSQKKKAELESKWMQAEKHLRNAVKEAVGDVGQSEKAHT